MSKAIHLYDKTTGGAVCKRVPDAIANTTLSLLNVTCKRCLLMMASVSAPTAAESEAMQYLLLTYRSPCGKPGHFSNFAGSNIASLSDSGKTLYCVNCALEEKTRELREEIEELDEVIAHIDEQEQAGGARIGIPWDEGCLDWPSAAADAYERLQARLAVGVATYRVEQKVADGWLPVITVRSQKAAEEHVNSRFPMRVIEITTMERVAFANEHCG
jgi:hypothetical protein